MGTGSSLIYTPTATGTPITIMNGLYFSGRNQIHNLINGSSQMFQGCSGFIPTYNFFSSYMGINPPPGDGVFTLTVEIDMTNYNNTNNVGNPCNVANLFLTDTFNVVYGCMDPNSTNYNASATVNDCSC